jgi:hypothetical protein
MDRLGKWFGFGGGDNKEKAVSYYRGAAELGWKSTMRFLSGVLRDGEGCEKDLIQAVVWSAKIDPYVFWAQLGDAKGALGCRALEDLDCDFDQLCYSLGWGLYWYWYDSEEWNESNDEQKAFDHRCLNYYCSCVELQQKSILTFLLCWNRTTGVKGPGQMIAQMVGEERSKNLMKEFDEENEEQHQEPDTKRIKKYQ